MVKGDTTTTVLVVDLDDTLIRTDTLFENFWTACSSSWTAPLSALAAVPSGPLALKKTLAGIAPIDAGNLPYNPQVLEVLRDWRARGGKLALVTASLQSIADAVADHLQLFDEVHGSGDGVNLKGSNKARFLKERFGDSGFAYIGDSTADLAVWDQSSHAVTVTHHKGLRRRAEALGKTITHIETPAPAMRDYLRAMRPHQWLKNVLVFAPMLAAHAFTGEMLLLSILAFASFSLMASGTYIFNDLLDLKADRAHPRKRNRPFASGAIPVSHGTFMAPMLILGSLAIATAVAWQLLVVMAFYFVASSLYSFKLKRIVALDIVVLAGLYTLRILAGGAATSIMPSMWLLVFSIFFFFMLAGIKRQAELLDGIATGTVKAHGRGYHVNDLSAVSALSLASGLVAILIIALYADSQEVKRLYKTPEILLAVCPLMMFWVSRIAIKTHRGEMHDDPLVFAARDKTSYACLVLIFCVLIAGTLV